MATRVFFGRPPQHIVNWIISHRQTIQPDELDNSKFGLITQALENCSPTDFSNLDYVGSDPVLAAFKVGSAIADFQYATDGINPVNTTWINLGFNASIPEYVKYRTVVGNGYKHIWVKTTNSSGILSQISIGDAIYKREYSSVLMENVYSAEDKTITDISGTFEYGNNQKYAVPLQITVDSVIYDFCGYNITINSEAALWIDGKRLVSADDTVTISGAEGKLWEYRSSTTSASKISSPNDITFDVGGKSNATYGRNRWGCSDLRKWMNGTWEQSLIQRVSNNDGLLKNLCKTVNRTWLYDNGYWKDEQPTAVAETVSGNVIEHTVDSFWLLDNGNVNCTDTDYYGTESLFDQNYCTSYFNKIFNQVKIFNSDDSHIRYYMSQNGNTTSSPCYWWLRSAYSYNSNFVGLVHSDGYVNYNYANIYYGVLPACTIG